MTHQVNIFLLLFGALQGWLLSFWFFKNSKKKIAHIYFGLFLMAIGLQLMFKVVSKSWLMDYFKIPYFFSYALPYLIGPLLFLFIRSQKHSRFRLTDLLHFLPFLISATAMVLLILTGVGKFFSNAYTLGISQTISLGIYMYLSYKIATPKLKQLVSFVGVAEWIIVVAIEWMTFYPHMPYIKFLFIFLTVLVYWISYKSISESSLFFEHEARNVPMAIKKTVKYARSSLKQEESNELESQLKQLMNNEKLFLDPSLTLDTLSARLNTSKHHLSQVINGRLNQTYSSYINNLRLDEAYARLADPSNHRYTLSAIAFDSGFSSISIFNSLFKKKFGITPSGFRDQFLRKIQA